MLTVPNIQNVTNASNGYDFQCWEDETDNLAFLYAEAGLAYVISGMQVTPDSGMTVSVASGYYVINGTVYSYSGGTVTVSANSGSSGDRRDIITINSSGTLTATAGTPCGTEGWIRTTNALPPVKPAIPTSPYQCILAEIAVLYNTTSISSINIVDKTVISGGAPGTLLARAIYAPSSAHTYTITASSTGLTALDTTNLAVTFIAPPSGNVEVAVEAFWKGGAAAGTSCVLGVVSSTASPGTFVASGLAWLTPTATAADNGVQVRHNYLVTGLTPGNAYTYYAAAMYSGTAPSIIAQNPGSSTTLPTGGPAQILVLAA